MSPSKEYHIFISHSWARGEHYTYLTNLLDQIPDFFYNDHSFPRGDSVGGGTAPTREVIQRVRKTMLSCGVVIVLASKEATESQWVDREITFAKEGSKPVLVVKPPKNGGNSKSFKKRSEKIVSWDTNEIVSAIRELA